ncbi:MAG: hypothetical protein AAF587_40975 [Bacteroidota bacterium]
MPEGYEISTGTGPGLWVPPGDYVVDVYKITATVSHNLPSTDSIIAAWPRASSSTLLQLFDPSTNQLKAYERAYLLSYDQQSAKLEGGYLYQARNSDGSSAGWWPFPINQLNKAELTYSLLIHDKAPFTSITSHKSHIGFHLFPNPLHKEQIISFETDKKEVLKICLMDLAGSKINQSAPPTAPKPYLANP